MNVLETSKVHSAVWLWVLFAAIKVLAHALVGDGYGYFRDEFYYIACSENLAWGYVDHPPLSIVLLKLSRMVFGDSIPALHVLPILSGAVIVVLVGWMAKRLGGGLFAQAIAMSAALITPQYLGGNALFSMNSFDLLFWTLGFALLVRLFKGGSNRLWLWLGVVLGLGLLNKISMLWFGAGLGAGLLLTQHRRMLRTPWPWVAAGIAVLMFLPHLLWQATHDWPTLEFMRNAASGKMITVDPIAFWSRQILSMHPLNLLVWLPGLAFLMMKRDVRALGVLYLAVVAILMLNGTSRAGYLAPAFTVLFAAGGVALASAFSRPRLAWLKPVTLAILLAGGAVLAPLALPILPVETFVAYSQKLGVAPSTDERKELAELPQHYADRFGWDGIVREFARVYETLPPEDKAKAGIFVNNYGEAGAIDFLGPKYGLPRATSGHNNYWLWGARGYSGEVLILIGGSEEDHLRSFEQVELAGRTDCGYCMPYENNQPIYIARGLRAPLAEAWPRVKHFD